MDNVLTTEYGVVSQRLLPRNVDTSIYYDVIVVGSGFGGGLLASALADNGANVLVLEAGSYLFPTHVGNLPRTLPIGQFDKNVWHLFQDFGVINYQNVDGSNFQGAQGFNLGGRSIFWGALTPRQTAWQLQSWPAAISDYLLERGWGTRAPSSASIARRPPRVRFKRNQPRSSMRRSPASTPRTPRWGFSTLRRRTGWSRWACSQPQTCRSRTT